MPLIGFACPLCGRCFPKRLDYGPEEVATIETCPYCNKEVELTPDHVTGGLSIHLVILNAVRRLRQQHAGTTDQPQTTLTIDKGGANDQS